MSIRLTLALLCLVAPATAFAQAPEMQQQDQSQIEQRAADVVAVLKGEKPIGDVFTDVFVAQVPQERLDAMTQQMQAQFGPLLGLDSVTPTGNPGAAKIVLRFEKALASGPMQLEANAPYKVAGLLLNDFEPIGDSAEKVVSDISALPGEASIYLAPLDGGEPLLSYQADKQFAIGSTFKLYVLSALARSIAAGTHSWDEVVPLTEKSFPSGQMQNWPAGAPVTVQTLATMMISISDNTATDQLIRLLGRKAVEAELGAAGNSNPSASIPFLTTREMFALKTLSDQQAADYLAADDAAQAQMLEGIDPGTISADRVNQIFGNGPRHIGIEWFASGKDIAAVFDRLRKSGDPTVLDILSVNQSVGPAEKPKWAYIGYKGGSEPGVLNLSWLLRDPAGAWYLLAMSWNNPNAVVEQQGFELLAQRALALASGRDG